LTPIRLSCLDSSIIKGVSPTQTTDVIQQQLAYYRARAAEYDQWWLRQGRYDRGPAHTAEWVAEAAMVKSALADFRPAGRILELACGTGIWTEQLLPYADFLTAVDASAEMLEINAVRVRLPPVRYV
jgi:ubiquinone/menaquinone biosynthesis C-methylase UbiE